MKVVKFILEQLCIKLELMGILKLTINEINCNYIFNSCFC